MIIKTKSKLVTDEHIVKVVVDVENGILSAICELHIDCADELVADGSDIKNLWGANADLKNKTIAYFSMINLRPNLNKSMEIKVPEIREKVGTIIEKLLF